MLRKEILLALACAVLAVSAAGRSLRQDNPFSNFASEGGRFSLQNTNSQDPQPSQTTNTGTTTTGTTTDTNANANANANVNSASTIEESSPPPLSPPPPSPSPPPPSPVWPGHNYTIPTNITVKIEAKKPGAKKEEIPECSGASASCCKQSINVFAVDEHTKVPLPGQKCTYSEVITTVITPACADMPGCWHGCNCAEKAVIQTTTVNKTVDLLVNPYPPAIWAVKDKPFCYCAKPVEQKVNVTVVATASASASAGTHN